jgi:hypothetical protein
MNMEDKRKNSPDTIVSLYLTGALLSPERITEQLGVQPSRVRHRGSHSTVGDVVKPRVSAWVISLKATNAESVSDQIALLLAKIGIDSKELSQIENVDNAVLDICLLYNDSISPRDMISFEIETGLAQKIARSGLRIRFTIM